MSLTIAIDRNAGRVRLLLFERSAFFGDRRAHPSAKARRRQARKLALMTARWNDEF
jgi:hypothetical protein